MARLSSQCGCGHCRSCAGSAAVVQWDHSCCLCSIDVKPWTECFPSTALLGTSWHHVLLLWGSQHWDLCLTGTGPPRSSAPGPSLWCPAPSAVSRLHVPFLFLCPISKFCLYVPSPCPVSTSHFQTLPPYQLHCCDSGSCSHHQPWRYSPRHPQSPPAPSCRALLRWGRASARPWGVGGETQGNSATRCHGGVAVVMGHGDGPGAAR